jgi:adenosylhomocysteine nucleosidase
MKSAVMLSVLAAIGFNMVSMAAAGASDTIDATPRTAVISAYEPEWVALRAALKGSRQTIVDRTTFLTGTIEGRPVVLFLSGVSIVNAALTTQLALDHFNVSQVVFSGIAGGVDPALSIGDVIVPDQWSEYLEADFARETKTGYVLPSFESKTLKNFGMIFPQPVEIARPDGPPEKIEWFPADTYLLSEARSVAGTINLAGCTADRKCLPRQPIVVVGGNGVSGQAFVDNAKFRDYVFSTFSAKVVDMESAAVAHVAYINAKPFIAFRSVSDLAGADPVQNEEATFEQLASANSATVVKAFLKSLR